MSAIFPAIQIDKDSMLCDLFLPYQVSWIRAEDPFHEQKKQVFALAEKSVRIGWTYADAFKNIRKRLRFPRRDYLFATKDYPSALEYMRVAHQFTRIFNFTRAIVSHGEDYLKVEAPRGGSTGKSLAVTEEIKIGYIKFDNGSRIIAFSAHPQAMAVYGGDVGLDEFAKHPNAELLWQTAQGRVTWAYDLAVWSSHEGDDTLFNQFAQQARLQCSGGVIPSPWGEGQGEGDRSARPPNAQREKRQNTQSSESESRNTHLSSVVLLTKEEHETRNTPSSPWNLYFKVTITDAIEHGLLTVINRTRDANLTPTQFLADCRARAGLEQIFQQSYMCNPVPGGASIVDWSAIERCRSEYEIERVHLEAADITKLFGDFNPATQQFRQSKIEDYLREHFSSLLNLNLNPSGSPRPIRLGEGAGVRASNFRLGFDIAASGQGDLCAIYIDEARADDLWLRALLTCRTEDWDFIKTVLFFFLQNLSRLKAAGDESGLGRQICWEAAQQFSYKFTKVNFAAKKQDLGFALMNQLSVAEKHIPKDHPDIAADLFALRKSFIGNKWVFSEGRNHSNSASHCDMAWAAALATFAHHQNETGGVSAAVAHETGWFDGREFHPYKS